jgi:hypothetical protein
MNVVLWLTIIQGDIDDAALLSSGTLWTKSIETGCVPVVGASDDMYPWFDDEDGELGGPGLAPRRRFMGASGQWHVELAKVVIDPPELVRQQLMAEFAHGRGHEHTIWWTESDGPWPDEKLIASGWTRHSDR